MKTIPWHLCSLIAFPLIAVADLSVDEALQKIDSQKGIVSLLGAYEPEFVTSLAKASELSVYFQSSQLEEVTAVRTAAESAGLLGRRVFADVGTLDSIHLGKNVADAILVAPSAVGQVTEGELLRALRPKGAAYLGEDRQLIKPVPAGIDEWTHPFHGPDNNPQSNDQLARGKFHTQFIAAPKFSPMPEQTVIAGGRIYKAMGHIAHKANQNAMLNTLLCTSAYNGVIHWKRELPKGFMIHRNTMIATDDALLMGDHTSCKVIDGKTGEIRREITVPEDITDGPVWKWMAEKDGVLYGLVGNPEDLVKTQRSIRRGLGHWPWGMWEGHEYDDPRTSFGFGRTFVAVELATGKLLWHYRDKQFLDARAVCMGDGRLYCYAPEKFLACVDASNGELLWRNSDEDLLAAIGPNGKAQHYVTGYATTSYMKYTKGQLFFAGPQRERTLAASAKDGKLQWTYPIGNLQLVLREDAVYAAGPQKSTGVRLDYPTGKVLETFPARRACTRATGSVDSIFYRATGGTVRVLTETNTAQHIAPMRPPCQDGVLISNGHLYWGPWMCGCQLSLYGHIGLCPATPWTGDYGQALTVHGDLAQLEPLNTHKDDWVSYRGKNDRSDAATVGVPDQLTLQWTADICQGDLPTAPVTSGGLVFIADRLGAVRALDRGGKVIWKNYTGGPIYYPPAIHDDRLFVGSADGRVYAYEARTGRPLWTFRVAPEDRWIPVFGKLISRWPVAGGVVAEKGTVYAVAGITHYDGTYIVAIDAVTGSVKAQNTTSGAFSSEVDSGISLQGNLTIAEGELRFLGGGVYEVARFDLNTLQCLNKERNELTSQYRTAFYPYYPDYGKYVSLEHTFDDNRTLSHDASYEGSLFGNLTLEAAPAAGEQRPVRDAAREFLRRRGEAPPTPKKLWQDKTDRRFTSFVVSGERLLVTGHPDDDPEKPFLASINIADGADVWTIETPAGTVKGGTAIDHEGRIYVALENGQLLCFAAKSEIQ